jgi:hypothetical protein
LASCIDPRAASDPGLSIQRATPGCSAPGAAPGRSPQPLAVATRGARQQYRDLDQRQFPRVQEDVSREPPVGQKIAAAASTTATNPSHSPRRQRCSGESMTDGRGIIRRTHQRRCLFTALATAAANAAPRCGASSLAHASNQQMTCGASQSLPIGRRASAILASEVFPDPHGPLIAMVSGVLVSFQSISSARASAYAPKPRASWLPGSRGLSA